MSHDAREHSETQSGHSDPYVAIQRTDDFVELRRRFRRFVFPMTALFLAWYFLYVLLAAYAPEFMSQKVSPQMAEIFGKKPFDPATGEGFGCNGCHKIAM